MRKSILFLSILFALECYSQNAEQDAPIEVYSTTLFLQTENLKKKPFYRRNILRSKKYNTCEFNKTVNFAVGIDKKNQVTLFIDEKNSSAKPIIQTIDKSSFTYETIKDFFDSTLERFANQEWLNTCVYNFVNRFSRHLVDSVDFETIKVTAMNAVKAPTVLATFPVGAIAGGTYTVTRADASLTSGGTMFLPQNFTIKVADDVDRINWYFDKIIFEEGATIDLSRQVTIPKPPKAANGRSALSCQGSWQDCCGQDGESGKNGEQGQSGQKGVNGTNLVLQTHFIPASGNLWIKTDGSKGGDGGDGGDGGRGNWGNCGFLGIAGKDGGNGGHGGDGAPGGDGGNTSSVTFELLAPNSNIVVRRYPVQTSLNCNPSSRPPSAAGNTGVVAIYGSPGCGGQGGIGGNGGERGHGCNCGWGRADAHDGYNGVTKGRAPDGRIGLGNQ